MILTELIKARNHILSEFNNNNVRILNKSDRRNIQIDPSLVDPMAEP